MWKSVVRPADFALSFALWMAAVASRIAFGDTNIPHFETYLKFGFVVGLATSITFTKSGLYNSFQSRSLIDELFRVLRSNVIAILLFVLFTYFFAPDRISRGSLLIYFGLSSFTFVCERIAIRSYLKVARANDRNRRNVVLVGNGTPLADYAQKAAERPDLGVRVIGTLDAPSAIAGLPAFADVEALRASGQEVDAFVVSYASQQSERIESFLKESYNDLVQIFVLPDLKSYAFLGVRLEDLGGVPMLALNQPRWSATDVAVKRLIDIVGSGFGLLILSPLLISLAALVKLTSRGPIFYGQDRMGLDGSTFKMWKFRSMRPGPANATPGWTVENDPRRTSFGTFLRKTSLDELPQLWNVFVGQMSLVGPRPEQPFYVENFRKEIPAYMLRHKMKAGITGWAQINGWRGDTSLHKRIECDLYYIRNWSVGLDIKILILTIWRGFINRNAY